jgi:hypothetical protein
MIPLGSAVTYVSASGRRYPATLCVTMVRQFGEYVPRRYVKYRAENGATRWGWWWRDTPDPGHERGWEMHGPTVPRRPHPGAVAAAIVEAGRKHAVWALQQRFRWSRRYALIRYHRATEPRRPYRRGSGHGRTRSHDGLVDPATWQLTDHGRAQVAAHAMREGR